MKKITLAGLMMVLAILSACGGGGGSSPPAPPTKAVVTLSSSGTGTIGAIQATVNLPEGVTLKSSPSSINPSVVVTDAGVFSVSGMAMGADFVLATYETMTTGSRVLIHVAKLSGFRAGAFAVLNCDITPGTSPAAADFSITDPVAKDLLTSADMPGVNLSIGVVLQ